jgi:hypothetical protein
MKIISKFRDYYDNVAWTYGGGDPKIRYERHEIENVGPFKMRLPFAPLRDKWQYSRVMRTSFWGRSLIVGDRIYTVFSECKPYLAGRPNWFLPDIDHELITRKETLLRWEHRGKELYYVKTGKAIDLCRLVGQPVFWLDYERLGTRKNEPPNVKVFREIPKLCEIMNFAKLYPADQIYQDLSYVIGNLRHEPPDDNPPVQVDAKIRLEKHGFDPKTSFRGK